MLAIKNNLMADQAARQLGINYDDLSTSVRRLSSGLRIVDAGDDAAGMAVRELIRADVGALRQGSRNAQDAISMLQTTEGAVGVIDDILIRMRELAEQSATESYSDDQRRIMSEEFAQLIDEIDRITKTTTFNGLNLLDDEMGGNGFPVHLGSIEMIDVKRADMTASGLGIGPRGAWAKMSEPVVNRDALVNYSGKMEFVSTSATQMSGFTVTLSGTLSLKQVAQQIQAAADAAGTDVECRVVQMDGGFGLIVESETKNSALGFARINITSANAAFAAIDTWSAGSGDDGLSIASEELARDALDSILTAIRTKDDYRAKLGYMMNRLEAATEVIGIQAENLLAAESRISDVDVAKEMAAMTRHQVMTQAGISMLSQANQMPQMALSLLQN